MSVRTLLVTLLALVCGGSAAIGVNMFLNSRTAKAETETVPVLVAVIDIERATRLTADHIRRQDWPKDLVPPGVAINADDIVGRSTLEKIVQNEPILTKKLAEKDAGEGLGVLVKEGMRAKTIMTPTPSSSVGSFLQPGCRVDICFTMLNPERTTGGVVSGVILEDIEVLAVEGAYRQPRDARGEAQQVTSNVTLHVKPEEALILEVAMSRGTLSLVLRGQKDRTPGTARVLTLPDLLRIPAERVPEAPKPPPPAAAETKKEPVKEPEEDQGPSKHRLDIIQGGTVKSTEFDIKKPKKDEKKREEGVQSPGNSKPAGDDKSPAPAANPEGKTPS
jgi:pilus assembly protein CpaB